MFSKRVGLKIFIIFLLFLCFFFGVNNFVLALSRVVLPSKGGNQTIGEKGQKILNAQPKEIENVPEDIKNIVPQKDLLELYCLETKARSGEFFSALFALESILTPVSKDLKTIGIEAEIPDIHSYTSQAHAKLNAVCSAKNLDEAQLATKELKTFGEQVRMELMDLKYNLARELKAKGEKLKKESEERVKKEIEAWIQSEKSKEEDELNALANQLAEEAKNKLIQEIGEKQFADEASAQAYAQSRAEQIRAEIEAKINKLVEEKKKKLEEAANQKAAELLGGDVEKFKDIAQRMENIEDEIEGLMAQKSKEYEQYKVQAAQKRKELILMVINKKVEEGMKKLQEKNEMLKKLGIGIDLNDKINLLQKNKEDLIKKIDEAIAKKQFDSINLIIYEMQERWKKEVGEINWSIIQAYPPETICGFALRAIKHNNLEGKTQQAIQMIDLALKRNIGWAKEKCQELNLPPDDIVYQKTTEMEKELISTKEKINSFISQIQQVKNICSQINEKTKAEDIAEDLISFRDKGNEFKKEMEALNKKYGQEWEEINQIMIKNPKKYKL